MSFEHTDYNQSSMEEWNFRSWHVGADQGGANANAITSENFLMAAGPARLDQVSGDFANTVFPLGMMEQASVSQQKMLQKVREIGSRRTYQVSSYASGQISLSRVMYSQASLLRVLTLANGDGQNLDNPAGESDHTTFEDFGGDEVEATRDRSFYINLQSELFDRPIGLLFYILDQRNIPYGAMYAEDVFIQNHSFSLAAQGVSISERTSLVFDRLVPVKVSTG